MWCGALITEVDVERVAWQGEDTPNPFMAEDGTPKSQWEPGSLVAIAGNPDGGSSAHWRVEPPEDGKMPFDSCMALDTAVTA